MHKILIERATKRCRVTLLTARPGVVIGRKGAEIFSWRSSVWKLAAGFKVRSWVLRGPLRRQLILVLSSILMVMPWAGR